MASKNIVVKVPAALSDPKYKGKHILMAEGKVVAAGNWKKISSAFDKVAKAGKTPELAYIPKADSLILKVSE